MCVCVSVCVVVVVVVVVVVLAKTRLLPNVILHIFNS